MHTILIVSHTKNCRFVWLCGHMSIVVLLAQHIEVAYKEPLTA